MTAPDPAALDRLRDRIAGLTARAATAPPDPETVSRVAAILAGPRLRRARHAARRRTGAEPATTDGP